MSNITIELDTQSHEHLDEIVKAKGQTYKEWLIEFIHSYQVFNQPNLQNDDDLDKAMRACGFGSLEGKGGVTFADDWVMTDEELLNS